MLTACYAIYVFVLTLINPKAGPPLPPEARTLGGGVTSLFVMIGLSVLVGIGATMLFKPRVEQAGFAVLKAPDIPSVLVEAAFISNPEEEAKLNSEAYQEQLAQALMRGIEGYFAKNPPLARNRSV